jgi:hypothetical protein
LAVVRHAEARLLPHGRSVYVANLTDEVTVFARDPYTLFVNGHGVSVSDLELERDGKTVSGRYRKQYSGLRLLMHAGGKYFLLPSHWRRGRDRVAEIPDDGQVRIEILTHLQ